MKPIKILLFSFLFGAVLTANAAEVADRNPNLQDLWVGRASFVPYKKIIFSGAPITGHENNTSSVIVHDGKWYAMNRITKSTKSGCPNSQMVMGLRESPDRGSTWGAFKLITNDDSKFCGLADGDLYFDKSANTWFVLVQCLSKTRTWDLCLYTKKGENPMLGDYIAATDNPVVRGGSLWSRICALPNSHCLAKIYDEGTPQIVKKENGYFYVTFHGYDHVHGYRGMVKTTDFRNWIVNADDLPDGIMLSSQDCKSISAGCIGGGHDSMLLDGGYYYHLIETPDGNLACKAGARWPVSLFRSRNLNAKSGKFESFGENPLIINLLRSPVGCELQYANLFRGTKGRIYLYVTYFSNKPNIEWYPAAIFRLEFSPSRRPQIVIDSESIAALDKLPARIDNTILTFPN